VQGRDDEDASLERTHGIARHVVQNQLLELDHCGHSAQRDQPENLISSASAFLRGSTISGL